MQTVTWTGIKEQAREAWQTDRLLRVLLVISVILLGFWGGLTVAGRADGDPIATPNVTPAAPWINWTSTNFTIRWDPEHGYYTRWWFIPSETGFINVYGFFYSLTLPVTALIGDLFFFIIWATICMGLYLYTQGTELPFVVGVLSGALMAGLMGEDALLVMTLTMVFAGGGILTKALLGRV